MIRLMILLVFYMLSWAIKSQFRHPQPHKISYKKRNIHEDDLVVIDFIYVPIKCPFRYQRKWWKKISNSIGTTAMGEEKKINEKTPVGVFKEDVPRKDLNSIIKV